MYRLYYLILSFPLLFISCNNDDDSSPPIEEANFYALTVGNTWTYENFMRVGQTEEFESVGVIEEILITETSVINDEIFFTFQITTTGNDTNNPLYPENGITTIKKRDSLGYLIDENHSILFSKENLTDYLISENEWGDIYGVLKEEMETIIVEAGTFNTTRNEQYALLNPSGEMSPGRQNLHYAEGIGEIYHSLSGVSNPLHKWERRLMSFNIID